MQVLVDKFKEHEEKKTWNNVFMVSQDFIHFNAEFNTNFRPFKMNLKRRQKN